jgi:hypothetical protein
LQRAAVFAALFCHIRDRRRLFTPRMCLIADVPEHGGGHESWCSDRHKV